MVQTPFLALDWFCCDLWSRSVLNSLCMFILSFMESGWPIMTCVFPCPFMRRAASALFFLSSMFLYGRSLIILNCYFYIERYVGFHKTQKLFHSHFRTGRGNPFKHQSVISANLALMFCIKEKFIASFCHKSYLESSWNTETVQLN